MSSIEELLYSAITSDESIADLLATYDDKPAFFERQAPADNDAKWGNAQYPRADYVIDMTADPARKTSGAAILNIWSTYAEATGPEQIEAAIRAALDGAIFHPEGEAVTIFKWSRTDAFEQQAHQDALVFGYSMSFDLLAFPAQTTTDPDPIAALNNWAVNAFNSLEVDPEEWQPTNETPAIYWRLGSLSMGERWVACSWIDATIYGHIIAPAPTDRLTWIKQITEQLALTGTIAMDDGSPLIIKTVAADSQRDHLRDGQLTLSVRYGVLPAEAEKTELVHAYINKKYEERVIEEDE